MDIVGTASAVAGIVQLGLLLHQTLTAFAAKAFSADQYVQTLIIDINLTTSALENVCSLLKQDEELKGAGRAGRIFNDDSLANTQRASDQCAAISKSIIRFIVKKGRKGKYEILLETKDEDYLKIHRDDALSKLESINWALSQDQVELHLARLATLKLSLVLIFTSMSLLAQQHSI